MDALALNRSVNKLNCLHYLPCAVVLLFAHSLDLVSHTCDRGPLLHHCVLAVTQVSLRCLQVLGQDLNVRL